jgi:hypothetical protein
MKLFSGPFKTICVIKRTVNSTNILFKYFSIEKNKSKCKTNLEKMVNILHYQAYDQLIVSRVEKLHYDNHVYVMLHNEQMQSKGN